MILLEEDGCPILLSVQLYSLKKTPDLFPEDEDEDGLNNKLGL